MVDRRGEVMASVAIHNDMFTADVIADPFRYYGHLREEDPVPWNEKYELGVITRHDDVVWMTRHYELFSSAVFRNDLRPPILPSMSRTWGCTNTSGITRLTSSSNMIAPSIWRCARWCMAISRPSR
jgi:hypothetical protein